MKVKTLIASLFQYSNPFEILLSGLRGKEPEHLVLPNGIQIYSPPKNDTLTMVKDIFFASTYTPPDLPIEKNDSVVDIGANIGIFSLFAAGKTENRVFAFEASPDNYEFLCRNIRSNVFKQIQAYSTAVCDHCGPVTLYLARKSGGNNIV